MCAWNGRVVFCVVVCCAVSSRVCWCWSWCAMCVEGGVCALCACVARLGTRNNPPRTGSARLRVYIQNASMCASNKSAHVQHAGVLLAHTETFRMYTRRRAEPAHGGRLSGETLEGTSFQIARGVERDVDDRLHNTEICTVQYETT